MRISDNRTILCAAWGDQCYGPFQSAETAWCAHHCCRPGQTSGIHTHTHTLHVGYSGVSPGVGTRQLESPKNLTGLNLGISVFVHVYKMCMCSLYTCTCVLLYLIHVHVILGTSVFVDVYKVHMYICINYTCTYTCTCI